VRILSRRGPNELALFAPTRPSRVTTDAGISKALRASPVGSDGGITGVSRNKGTPVPQSSDWYPGSSLANFAGKRPKILAAQPQTV
jgi:hypothetical protein